MRNLREDPLTTEKKPVSARMRYILQAPPGKKGIFK